MQVFLTFDYELFFGTATGTVEKCILEPTASLLKIAEKHAVPMTFFVDVGYLVRLQEQLSEFPQLQADYDRVAAQIQQMLQQGCDVQLHIHPHWERSFYTGSKWEIHTDGAYKLADFSEEEAVSIVRKYADFLTRLTGKAPCAYRAGGWCVQPFSLIEKIFAELGIRYDSSVFPGGKFASKHYAFDFTSVPRFSDAYSFQSDVCQQVENGQFTEIPIASWNYSPLFYWKLYVLGRLFPEQHKMLGDGIFVAQPGRKKQVLTHFTWNHVSSDGYYSSMLIKQAKFYDKKQVNAFVVIGHPKSATQFSLKKLDKFVAFAKSKHTFVNFETCTL